MSGGVRLLPIGGEEAAHIGGGDFLDRLVARRHSGDRGADVRDLLPCERRGNKAGAAQPSPGGEGLAVPRNEPVDGAGEELLTMPIQPR